MLRKGVVLVVAALLVGACASTTEDEASPDTAAVEGSTTSEVPVTDPPSTTAPAPTYRLLTEEELTATLLGVEDMPAGYSQDPPGDPGARKTFCDYTPPFIEQVKVSRDFTKGGGLSAEVVSLGLRQYASPEEARAAFDAMATALASCPGESYGGSEFTYSPMSTPEVGDASLGLKVNIDGTDVLQTFALVGPTMVNTGGGGLMNANADEVFSLLEAQINSYEAAAVT